jgi:hypothetical protein
MVGAASEDPVCCIMTEENAKLGAVVSTWRPAPALVVVMAGGDCCACVDGVSPLIGQREEAVINEPYLWRSGRRRKHLSHLAEPEAEQSLYGNVTALTPGASMAPGAVRKNFGSKIEDFGCEVTARLSFFRLQLAQRGARE